MNASNKRRFTMDLGYSLDPFCDSSFVFLSVVGVLP